MMDTRRSNVTTIVGGRQAVWVGVAAGSAAMAWSRTYLQVHWLSDVAAGTLLGGAVTLATFDAVDHTRGR